MNYGKEGNLTFLTFMCLVLNVLYLTPRTNYQSLILSLILEYSSISKAYRVYNKKTQTVEKTIHISFKERKKDADQKVADPVEDMENLSLNNDAHNHQDLQIATRNENDVFESHSHQYVFDDISEEPKESLIKRRYTGVRDLRAIS